MRNRDHRDEPIRAWADEYLVYTFIRTPERKLNEVTKDVRQRMEGVRKINMNIY